MTEAINSIGMKLLETGFIDPRRVKLNPSYQRLEELGRLKRLREDFSILGGFDLAHPIVLNDKNFVVNGGHRTRISIEKNLETIPYVRYKFNSIEDEIKYFNLCQVGSKGMTSRDLLFSQFQLGTPYASLVYYICSNSDLVGKHNLRMTYDHMGSRQVIKVENICYIVNYIALGRRTCWAQTSIANLDAAAAEVLSVASEKANSIRRINEFLRFFFECFGPSTATNEVKFREHFLMAAMNLYLHLKEDDRFVPNFNKICNKLKRFSVTDEVTKNHKDKILEKLLWALNSNRKLENHY